MCLSKRVAIADILLLNINSYVLSLVYSREPGTVGASRNVQLSQTKHKKHVRIRTGKDSICLYCYSLLVQTLSGHCMKLKIVRLNQH